MGGGVAGQWWGDGRVSGEGLPCQWGGAARDRG